MNEIFQKIKIPLIVIVALFLGFLAYNSFIKKDEKSPTELGGGLNPINKSTVNKAPDVRILPLLTKVRDIQFDGKIFEDPVYLSLDDKSQPIIPEDPGRPNPFAPSTAISVTSSVENLGFSDSFSTSTRR